MPQRASDARRRKSAGKISGAEKIIGAGNRRRRRSIRADKKIRRQKNGGEKSNENTRGKKGRRIALFGVRRLAAALRLGQSIEFISDLKAAASRRTPKTTAPFCERVT
jgi:hypothetical protein